MELKITKYEQPQSIEFNYEELKRELSEKVKSYETLVYTDDQIKSAKSDRASLNKLKKALNDERLRREREFMAPFEEFKSQINEIIAIIDKPVCLIDKQIKGYEEKCRAEKLESIKAVWDDLEGKPDWLKLEAIFNDKWLNASVSMRDISQALFETLERVNADLATLSNLPLFGFEACEVYKDTLDLKKALTEGHKLAEIQQRKIEEEARKKAEAENKPEMPIVEPEVMSPRPIDPVDPVEAVIVEAESPADAGVWINFSACLTVAQAKELKAFFEARNIKFKSI